MMTEGKTPGLLISSMKILIDMKKTVKNTSLDELDQCPHCGSTSEPYMKVKFSGSGVSFLTWDGSPGDNTHLHDSLSYENGVYLYCSDCNKAMCKNPHY